MGADSERGKRAGDYVSGLMNDEERERAERDLEFDPAFRDAVIRLAESMHVFDRAPQALPAERWQTIAARLADLPQMRAATGDGHSAAVPFKRRPPGMGLHALPCRRAILVSLGLIAAFALGYLVGTLRT